MRCEWFALCIREAVGTQDHPVLGPVPICADCHKWYGRNSPQTIEKVRGF